MRRACRRLFDLSLGRLECVPTRGAWACVSMFAFRWDVVAGFSRDPSAAPAAGNVPNAFSTALMGSIRDHGHELGAGHVLSMVRRSVVGSTRGGQEPLYPPPALTDHRIRMVPGTGAQRQSVQQLAVDPVFLRPRRKQQRRKWHMVAVSGLVAVLACLVAISQRGDPRQPGGVESAIGAVMSCDARVMVWGSWW